jgi:uncharacterized membrane protein
VAEQPTNQPGATRAGRTQGAKLFFIAILGLSLRAYDLGRESYWLDEGASVYRAGQPLPAMIADTAGDVHPPLYYGLLHYWTGVFGNSEAGTRSLSVLFGLAMVLMMSRTAGQLFGYQAGPRDGMMAALSLFYLHYSQEARSYTLLGFLGLVSTSFYLQTLTRNRVTDSIGLSLANTLVLYTHNYGVFLVAVQILHFLLSRCRPARERVPLLHFLAAQVATVSLYAPWLGVLIDQVWEVKHSYWVPRPSWELLERTFVVYSGSQGLFYLFALLAVLSPWELKRGAGPVRPRDPFQIFQTGKWALCLRNPQEVFFLALWLLVSILAPFLYSRYKTPIFFPRLSFLSSIPFFLLACRGLDFFRRPWLRGLVVTVFLALTLQALQVYYTTVKKEQWREAVAYLEARAWPGELVLLLPGYCKGIFAFYSQRDDLKLKPMPESIITRQRINASALAGLTEQRALVWIVRRDVPLTPPLQFGPLSKLGWRIIGSRRFFQVEVYRLERGGHYLKTAHVALYLLLRKI